MCETAEVRRTLHAYCRLLDERRVADLVGTVYTDDAVDDRGRGEPLRGRAEIGAYFGRALAHLRGTAHLLSNVDVDVVVPGRAARATSRVTAYHWNRDGSGDTADFVLLGSYTDLLRRTDAGWRIEHRIVGALGPTGLAVGVLPAVFAGFGGRS